VRAQKFTVVGSQLREHSLHCRTQTGR